MSDGGLIFDVDANTRPLETALARAQRVAATEAGKMVSSLEGVRAKIGSTFSGASFDAFDARLTGTIQRFQGLKSQLDGLKGNALAQFASGQQASLSGIASQVVGAGGIKNFAATIGGPAGLAALAAGLAAASTQALAALQETGDQAGLTASQVAGLQAALGKLGVSSTDTSSLLKNLYSAMLDAKNGGQATSAAFQAAGVSIQNADGSLRPTIDVLQDLEHYLRGSGDEAGKTANATALLGAQLGGQFVGAVKNAGNSLDDMKRSTQAVGSAIEDDLARAAQAGIAWLDRLGTKLDQMYSRAKQVLGLNLSSADEKNAAFARLDEAQGGIKQLQMASVLRDVSPAEMAAANKELFDAAAAVQKIAPVPILSGMSPGEKPAQPATPAPAADLSSPNPVSAKSGGRSRSSSSDDGGSDRVDTVITDLERQAAAEKGLADAVGQTSEQRQRSVDLQKAEQAAQERGTPLTDAERAKVIALADAYSAAHDKIEAFTRSQQALADAAKSVGDTFESSIEGILVQGNSLQQTMKSLLSTFESGALKAILTGSGPFAGILGTAPAASATGLASVGGLFGNLAGLFSGIHLASGGRVVGHGSSTSDSVPAMLSHGEFVVNAAAATKNAGLLKAINAGGVARLAEGGFVASMPKVPSAVPRSAAPGPVISHHTTLNVTPADGVTPEQLGAVLDRQNRNLDRTIGLRMANWQRRFG